MKSPRSPSPQSPDNNNSAVAKFGTVRNLSAVIGSSLAASTGSLAPRPRPALNARPNAPPPQAPPPPQQQGTQQAFPKAGGVVKPPNHAPPPPPSALAPNHALPQAPNHAPPPPPQRTPAPQVPSRAPPAVSICFDCVWLVVGCFGFLTGREPDFETRQVLGSIFVLTEYGPHMCVFFLLFDRIDCFFCLEWVQFIFWQVYRLYLIFWLVIGSVVGFDRLRNILIGYESDSRFLIGFELNLVFLNWPNFCFCFVILYSQFWFFNRIWA